MQHISENHRAARAYAAAGIAVFAIEQNGKRPVTSNGYKDATLDISQIDAWWYANPQYNIAFSPGEHDLFVVDIDPGADPSFQKNLPPTYRVRTPRGGTHEYYRGTGRTTAGKLAPHVDTRSIGGYVLLPPSTVGGHRYVVEQDNDYSTMPDWFAPKLAVADAPLKAAVEAEDLPVNIERAKKLLTRCVEAEDVAVEGCGGDDRTYRMCCELLDLGLSQEKAKELLEEIWNPACLPPWSHEEIDLKLFNAAKHKQNETGAYAIEAPQEVFGKTVATLFPVKRSRFYFKDEEEQDNIPDPKWLIPELIIEKSTVLMYGSYGSYKSFLACAIGMGAATGKETFGTTPNITGPVFYGAREGQSHLRKARRAWRIANGIDGKVDFYLGNAPLVAVRDEVQEFGDQIRERLAGRKPSIIFLDTIAKCMAGLDENSVKDVGIFTGFCDSLVEHFDCTVVALGHSGYEGQRARGSSAFPSNFDTVLEVKAHKDTKAVEVWIRKHKETEEREAPFTLEGRVVGPSLVFTPTTAEQHKLLVGVGTKDGLSPRVVGRALEALGAFGEDGAVSTIVLASQLTPARESDSVEARSEAITRTARALKSQSSKALEAYCLKSGKGGAWFLTAPK